MRHANVVNFYGVVLVGPDKPPQIVTEFMKGGSLEDALYPSDGGQSQLAWGDRRRIAKQVAAGQTDAPTLPFLRCLSPPTLLPFSS